MSNTSSRRTLLNVIGLSGVAAANHALEVLWGFLVLTFHLS
ncbi:MAG TPA: hypothetical protein PLO37_03975 [Candidatus Hydrogenedentes bacterium]|nr:hypothetical protein [Candidatus Hydrogenedentota bacterium]HPG65981.1 hypothetical protein [Candidatus Hydrogenedentota bacterium]